MSAIGNYIHLTHAGYRNIYNKDSKTLTNLDGDALTSGSRHTLYNDSQSALNDKRKELYARIASLKTDNKKAEELQRQYNKQIASLDNYYTWLNSSDDTSNQDDFYDLLIEAMEYYMNKEFPGFISNYSNLTVSKSKTVNDIKKAVEKSNKDAENSFGGKLSLAQNQQAIHQNTIKKRLSFIQILAENIEDVQTSQKIKQNLQQLQKSFEDIINECSSVRKRIDSFDKSSKYKYQKFDSNIDKKEKACWLEFNKWKTSSGGDRIKELLDNINSLMRSCFDNASAAKGALFEYWGYFVGNAIINSGMTSLTEALHDSIVNINKGLTAKETGGSGVLMKDISITNEADAKAIFGKSINKTYSTSDGKFFEFMQTQNKVDFILSGKKGENLKVSAKNYSFKKLRSNIPHIVKDFLPVQSAGSFLSYLINENTSANSFSNHYLNMVIPKFNSYPGSESDDQTFATYASGLMQEYHTLMQQAIFVQGLTGSGIKKHFNGAIKEIDNANIFMVHDSDSNYVYFIPMSKLIGYAFSYQNGFLIKDYDAINSVRMDFIPTGKDGQKATPAHQRIVRLLAKIHQIKVQPLVNLSSIEHFYKNYRAKS